MLQKTLQAERRGFAIYFRQLSLLCLAVALCYTGTGIGITVGILLGTYGLLLANVRKKTHMWSCPTCGTSEPRF